MAEILTIAIDGPAGAGKSTIAKLLAKKLNILFFSTGAIYRAFALKCLNLDLDPKDEKVAENICKNTTIDVMYQNGEQHTILDDKDVSLFLHTDKVSEYASLISKHKAIRECCVTIQREIAKKQSIIVDGRDIGTVVLKDANFKFYLDAKLEERAKRRFNDLSKNNKNISFEEVLNDMKQRDLEDTTRKISPLKVADDAIVVDSTNMNIDEVVEYMYNIIINK